MRKSTFYGFVLLLSLFGSGLAWGQSMVPAKLQATILVKMLEYDRSTETKTGPIVIAVLAPRNDAASQQLQQQLQESIGNSISIHGRAVQVRGIGVAELASVKPQIAYLTPGCADELDAIMALCRKHKILSVTGVPVFMKKEVAVGLFPKASGTQIVVNLDAARLGGADFESRFLRIVKVLRVEP